MALVAPLLILLLFGIWSVARAYNVKNTMDHAVREGARHAATIDPWDENTSPAAVKAVIDGDLSASAISPGLITVGCIELIDAGESGCDTGDGDLVTLAPADQVAVNIRYENYDLSFLFFSVTVDFASHAVSRHES